MIKVLGVKTHHLEKSSKTETLDRHMIAQIYFCTWPWNQDDDLSGPPIFIPIILSTCLGFDNDGTSLQSWPNEKPWNDFTAVLHRTQQSLLLLWQNYCSSFRKKHFLLIVSLGCLSKQTDGWGLVEKATNLKSDLSEAGGLANSSLCQKKKVLTVETLLARFIL